MDPFGEELSSLDKPSLMKRWAEAHLKRSRGKLSVAARNMGVSPRTLYLLRRNHGIKLNKQRLPRIESNTEEDDAFGTKDDFPGIERAMEITGLTKEELLNGV